MKEFFRGDFSDKAWEKMSDKLKKTEFEAYISDGERDYDNEWLIIIKLVLAFELVAVE